MSDPYPPVEPSTPSDQPAQQPEAPAAELPVAQPAAAAPQPAAPAPGWYPDPSGTGGTRWWDGTAWTQDVQPPATAPAPPPQYGYQAAPAAGGYAASTYAGAPGYAPAYQGGYVQPRKVGFGEAIRRAFAGWGDYKSRSTVAEYWWFVLFSVIIGIPMYVLFLVAVGSSFSTTTAADGTPTITSNGVSGLGLLTLFLLGVVYVVLFFVGLALAVRRLHDTDRSGWWYLISLVPFGSIVLLVFFVGASTPGPNRFGPVPQ